MRVSKPAHQRRAELVRAARALFDEKGVDATRVSDIVKRVGVAQGVFYYYFPSKNAMVEEVARQVAHEMDEKSEAILHGGGDFCHKLAAFIELMLALVDQFLGDDATCLPPGDMLGQGQGDMLVQCVNRLMNGLQALVLQGAQQGVVTARYPWQATLVTLYGIRRLAQDELPGRPMICALAEQALGLPAGALAAHLPPAEAGPPGPAKP